MARSAVGATRANLYLLPVVALTGIASTIVVARIVSVREFALFAAALAVRITVQYLADLGTGSASARLFAEMQEAGARRQALRLYRWLLVSRIFLTALIVAGVLAAPDAIADALALQDDERVFLAFVVAIAFVEIAGTLGFYALTALYDQLNVNRVSIAAGVAQPVLVVASAAGGLGLEGILAAVLAAAALRALALNFLALRALRGIRESGRTVEAVGATLRGVTAASFLSKTATWVHSRQVLTLLALGTRSRAEVAGFALAHDIAQQAVAAAAAPASGVLLPAFARTDDPERARRLFAITGRLAALLMMPIAAAALVVADDAIPLLVGDRYSDTLGFFQLLLPGLAVEMVLALPANAFALATNDLLRPLTLIRLAAVSAGAVYVVLASQPLILLAAWMVAVRVGSNVALHVVIWRRAATRLDAAGLARIAGAAALATGAGLLAAEALPGGGWEVAGALAAVVLTFLAATRALGALVREDAELVARVVPAARGLVGRLAPEVRVGAAP